MTNVYFHFYQVSAAGSRPASARQLAALRLTLRYVNNKYKAEAGGAVSVRCCFRGELLNTLSPSPSPGPY